MAKLPNGLGSHPSGKAGNLEYYTLKGRHYVRGEKEKTTKPPTLKQLAHRTVMAITGKFTSDIQDILDVGFAHVAHGTVSSAYNEGQKHAIHNIVAGQYPNQYIDYSKVLVTKGDLLPAINPSVSVVEDQFIFSWDKISSSATDTDHVMLLLWNAELKDAIFELCGAKRSTGRESVKVHSSWKGMPMECYISFRSAKNMECANSTYLGSIIF
ncbi:DUF6266 family protein [Pedobacter sp. MC2016-14]|uniref:DUF6266 family protein n=1 Tax=Pedobacter sp. MC2016-14 TaxID=2897327 RepID=UPI001E542A8F|nr:DUF6266 family protein [Pedobacter sp. MC2016-14]MCD0489982.1 DUF6266 family protein [Pedobacter sp. MC2016-14]